MIERIKTFLKFEYLKILSTYYGLFNSTWYCTIYTDLEIKKKDAFRHYLSIGWRDGKNPSLYFDGIWYLSRYEDVRLLGINPLVHYILFGRKEQRIIYPGTVNKKGRNKYDTLVYENGDWTKVNISHSEFLHYIDFSVDYPIVEKKNSDVSLIICVHNAFRQVEECLKSLIPDIDKLTNLIIIDDNSDSKTSGLLIEYKNNYPQKIKLHKNKVQLYYTKSANIGLRLSESDLSIMLNSDTIVTNEWIEKLLKVAYAEDSIGIVGPLSNAASLQSVPYIFQTEKNTAINFLPENISLNDLSSFINSNAPKNIIPLVPYVHGFCFCIKRSVIDKIGYFDETLFPYGFGEENDYCMRAMNAGFNLAIATNTYIYHSKSGSYGEDARLNFTNKSQKIIEEKYRDKNIFKQYRAMETNPVLDYMREKVKLLYSSEYNNM